MPANPFSTYGRIAEPLPYIGGKTFIVCPSGSSFYSMLSEQYPVDEDGVVRLYTSLAQAYANTVSGRNDVIVLTPGTHTVTEMLTVSKNLVHFVGWDIGGRLVQQGVKVQIGTTGVATDLAPVLVTGIRCSFKNIKFINGSTTNQTLYGFIDNGEGTLIEDCSMVKTAGLDDSGHAAFWMAGDSLTMKRCVLGQSNTPNTAAGFGILIDGKTGGATDGTVKENFLEDITINMSVGGAVQATSCFIKVADTAALNFGNSIRGFKGCNFIPSGGTIMTNGVLAPASIVAGSLFLDNPTFFGCTGVIDNSSAGIQIAAGGLAPVAAGGLGANLSD